MNRSITARTVPLTPDLEMIRAFTEVVFGYLEGLVPIRILTETGAGAETPWTETFAADDRLAARLDACARRAADARRALYVVPATLRELGRATTGNIAETGVILVDLDTGDIEAKRAFLTERLGPATMIVASGGLTGSGARKLHMYWRLTEPARGAELATVVRLRAALAEKAGGDPSLGRLHQPIRVPGSLHQKRQPAALVEIVDHGAREYDLADLAERVDRMPGRFVVARSTAPNASAPAAPDVAALKSMRVREGGRDGVTRFEALSKIIGHWLRRARLKEITYEEAWRAVVDHNAAQIDPPWDELRLRREFESLKELDPARSGGAAAASDGPAPAPLTEDGLAASFVERSGAEWRHVGSARAWRRWSGDRWVPDETRAIDQEIRATCRIAAGGNDKPGDAKRLGAWNTIQAVKSIAASDPAVAITQDAFDADPMLLNTPSGVMDLETGEVLPCRPEMLMTKIAGAAPEGPCQRWTAFLDEITGGDRELQAYLKRVAGYCLTGSTVEQVFFFLHGDGANGKSVFIDTLAAALGTYSRAAPFETFAASANPGHPTDLAGLAGARLVIVSETERGRAWSETRIKAVTGGDMMPARFMRGDFFEYRPGFKLVIAGNHLPRITSFGEAMRRRLQLIPFRVTFPAEKREPRLKDHLLGELGGIFSWMIEGCADWRERGLAPPAEVSATAAEYFVDEDVVGQWLDERCELGDGLASNSADLFKDWSAYAEAAGHPAGSQRALGEELAMRGFRKVRNNRARRWAGLALRRRSPS